MMTPRRRVYGDTGDEMDVLDDPSVILWQLFDDDTGDDADNLDDTPTTL